MFWGYLKWAHFRFKKAIKFLGLFHSHFQLTYHNPESSLLLVCPIRIQGKDPFLQFPNTNKDSWLSLNCLMRTESEGRKRATAIGWGVQWVGGASVHTLLATGWRSLAPSSAAHALHHHHTSRSKWRPVAALLSLSWFCLLSVSESTLTASNRFTTWAEFTTGLKKIKTGSPFHHQEKEIGLQLPQCQAASRKKLPHNSKKILSSSFFLAYQINKTFLFVLSIVPTFIINTVKVLKMHK